MAIIDRIKFDGMRNGATWLVYRYPGESFVSGAQLIVGEGQVAVFVKGGQALDYFSPGTHTLTSANIPLLRSIINLPFGGKTPYTSEIYFINTTTKLDMNWGTTDPIQLVDPKYLIKLRTRAFGQFGMRVDDYRVFLTQLIGSLSPLEVVNYQKMLDFFRGVLVMKVKALVAQAIINDKISALEIAASIDRISQYCKQEIGGEFERFGLTVVNFHIQSINFPDEDFEEINKILRDRASFEIIGAERYVTKRSFDTLEKAASNPGGMAGALTGAGVGLGAGLGVGSAMASLAQNLNPAAPKGQRINCPNCGEELPPGLKFCTSCGSVLTKKKICTHCKHENEGAAKFCANCGHELEE